MIIVRDLDNRIRRITTGSMKIANEFWFAIITAGGTPHATKDGCRFLLSIPDA